VEPNGKTCCCIEDTLCVVHVDTSNRTVKGEHELSIVGLKNPQAFHRLVWAMRRTVAAPSMATILDRGASLHAAAAAASTSVAARSENGEDVATLLREIRDELREHNAVLQSIKSSEGSQSQMSDAFSSLSVPIERVEFI
jgi:non-ribosomal peptide synthetase component E (peptide arylation enzyme)